eukprot:m.258740 g.258740  ORF g.258740 m.258740 type:complete len:338 (+) comp19649_c0_seq1:194-1207(+)
MPPRPNKDPRTGKAFTTPRNTRVVSQTHRRANSLESMQQVSQSSSPSPLRRSLASFTQDQNQGMANARRQTETASASTRPVVRYSRPQVAPSKPITISSSNTSPTRPTQTTQVLIGTPPIIVQSFPMSFVRAPADASIAAPAPNRDGNPHAETTVGFLHNTNPRNCNTSSSNSNVNSSSNTASGLSSAEASCKAALMQVDEINEELAEINTVISNVDSSVEKSHQLTLQCGREPGDVKLISKLTTPINHYRFQSPAQVCVALGKPLNGNVLKPLRSAGGHVYGSSCKGSLADDLAPTLERDCTINSDNLLCTPATPTVMRRDEKSAWDSMWRSVQQK